MTFSWWQWLVVPPARAHRRNGPANTRLELERLQDRVLPTIYQVTLDTDTGAQDPGGDASKGDLRYCIK